MKVLITGMTGLIGAEIKRLCLKENIPVNYLTTNKNKLQRTPNVQGFYWNPKSGEIDVSCIEGVNKIIHLAGASVTKRWTKSYRREIINSRIETARLLHTTLKKHSHQVTQFISASAIGIYPHSYQKLYNEDSSEIADNFLGEVVSLWEAEADRFTTLGLEIAKIRIGLVLASKKGALPQLRKPIDYYVGAPLGNGKQWQSWIHITDLGRLFLFAAKNNLDGVYNAVAPNPVTNKEMTQILANHLNKPLYFPNIPAFALKFLLGEMATLVLSSQLVSNQKINTVGFEFRYNHLAPALQDLI